MSRAQGGGTMRHGKMLTTATVLTAFLAAAPFTAGAQSKTEEAKEKAKSMTHDGKISAIDAWITAKTKIALLTGHRVKGSKPRDDDLNAGILDLPPSGHSAGAKPADGGMCRG